MELQELGRKTGALRGEPADSGTVLYEDDQVQIGVWECSEGAFPSKKDGMTELMVCLAGEGVLKTDGGEPITLEAGAGVIVPDGWTGTWDVKSAVRKFYVIVKAPAGPSGSA